MTTGSTLGPSAPITALRCLARPYSITYRVLHADGTVRWVKEHGRPHIQPGTRTPDWLDGVIVPIDAPAERPVELRAAA